uniref:Cytochrome c oxidase subunit 6C n=1 Tax=Cyprinus carpio TaxID=7962 RepID=A0A8C2K0D5_CYPCA
SLYTPALLGLISKHCRVHDPLNFHLSAIKVNHFKFTVTEPRKQAYADFYKHYDSMKEFSAMREAGVFESVRPTGK